MFKAKSKTAVSSGIDASNDVAPPLDFSYKYLAGFQDWRDEEPRFENEQRALKKSSESGKYKTKSIKFSYNAISDYENFETALDSLLENPGELEWLDFSFNSFSTIDQVLLNYPNLKMIYLHGNAIERLGEVNKLAGLPNLISLSLHGNPIESDKEYREYIISTLPQLKKLDFCTITKGDRAKSKDWNQKCGSRFKKKISRATKN